MKRKIKIIGIGIIFMMLAITVLPGVCADEAKSTELDDPNGKIIGPDGCMGIIFEVYERIWGTWYYYLYGTPA